MKMKCRRECSSKSAIESVFLYLQLAEEVINKYKVRAPRCYP